MTCREFDLHVADYLKGSLHGAALQRVERHAGECRRCREELSSLSRVWSLMGEIPDPETRPESASRFEEMLAAYRSGMESSREGSASGRRGGWLKAAAALVLLSVGVAAGFMMATGTGGGPGGARMYLVLIYEPSGLARSLAPAEMDRLEREYDLWWEELEESHRVLGWMRLDTQGGRALEGGGGVDELRPLPEGRPGEQLAWVVVVQADGIEEAAALARGCPSLEAGARVEIRPEMPDRG